MPREEVLSAVEDSRQGAAAGSRSHHLHSDDHRPVGKVTCGGGKGEGHAEDPGGKKMVPDRRNSKRKAQKQKPHTVRRAQQGGEFRPQEQGEDPSSRGLWFHSGKNEGRVDRQ